MRGVAREADQNEPMDWMPRMTRAAARRRGPRALPSNPRHILVGLLLPIGDTLLATPALAALRQRFPAARITALVSESNAGILEGSPDLTEVVVLPALGPGLRQGSAVQPFLSRLRALRAQRFDLVVNLSGASWFATHLSGGLRTRFGGRTVRHVFLDMPPLWWVRGGTPQYRVRHAIDHYFYALAPLGIPLPRRPDARVPRIALSSEDHRAARRVLQERGIASSEVRVAIHVGGDGFNGRKRWAPSRFAMVANELVDRCGAQVLLIGGKADQQLAEAAAALIPRNAHMLAGGTSLKTTAALVASATLFIGNDSAPMHIAAAVGTPALGIFGPSDWTEFVPVARAGTPVRVVHSSLPCSPCFRFIGNDAPWRPNLCYSYACLHAITPRQVLDAALDLLERSRS